MEFKYGTYTGEIHSTFSGTAKSGSPYLAVRFALTNFWNDVSGQWENFSAEDAVAVFCTLNDRAWDYSSKVLGTLGFNGDFENPDFSNTGNITIWYGANQNGYVGWNVTLDKESGEKKPALDAETLMKFSSRYQTANAPAPSAPAPPTPPAANPPATANPPAAQGTPVQAPSGDDIPF